MWVDAVPEHFRDEFLMIKRYTNLRLLYVTLLVSEKGMESDSHHAAKCQFTRECCGGRRKNEASW